jgi:hypothetical protein
VIGSGRGRPQQRMGMSANDLGESNKTTWNEPFPYARLLVPRPPQGEAAAPLRGSADLRPAPVSDQRDLTSTRRRASIRWSRSPTSRRRIGAIRRFLNV